MDFSRNAQLLAIGGNSGKVSLWQVSEPKILNTFSTTDVWSVNFSSDSRLLATGGGQGAQIWQVDNGDLLHTFKNTEVLFVRFSPEGKLLATTSKDRKVGLWSVETGQVLQVFDGYGISFSPNGEILAIGAHSNISLLQTNT